MLWAVTEEKKHFQYLAGGIREGLVVLVTFELGPGDQEFMAEHLQDLKSSCKGRVREEVGQQDQTR